LDTKPQIENGQAFPTKPKGRQCPSFVAFSSKCVDMLEFVLSKSTASDSSVIETLYALAKVIKSKYTSTPQGTDPVLWRNATTKAIGVIEAAVPTSSTATSTASSGDLHPFFTAVVHVATSILGPGGLQDLAKSPDHAQILADEAFDMESFTHLHKVINKNMALWYGASQKSREVCKSYSILLLQTSFICVPFYGDLPADLLNAPLHKFFSIRPGTVCPPTFPTRIKIPYLALGTLFDLVAQPDSTSTQSSSLAYAAAPYLLLRCAWALKMFITDQPLRSLTPLPNLLRLDLYTIMTKCLQTNTLDDAFTRGSLFDDNRSNEGASVGTGGGRHLQLLYPLVLKFMAVWRRVPRLRGGGDWMEEDEARGIESGLDEWLSVVGRDWEIR
jgi:hypothetical protein